MRAILALLAPLLAAAALAPHHADYALTLKSSREGSVIAAAGTMRFDLQDACTGLATAQRLALDLTDSDGRETHSVSDYATFESRDGTRLHFVSRQAESGADTQTLEGTAVLGRAALGGHADYAGEAPHRVPLPPATLLPSAHTAAILDAAAAGRRFLAAPLFDGTSADGAEDSFVVIGAHRPPAANAWPALAPLGSARVHIAFFDRTGDDTDTPQYEIGMRSYDNGVADELTLDFGDFVMQGRLATLTLYPPRHC